MTNKRKAPYSHSDGSNCWTKNCSRGNQAVIENEPEDNEWLDNYFAARGVEAAKSKHQLVDDSSSDEDTKKAIERIMREHDIAVAEANFFAEGIEYSANNPISTRRLASEYFGRQGYSTNGDSVVYLSLPNEDKVFIEMDTEQGNKFRTDVGIYSGGGKYYVKLTKSHTLIKNGAQLKAYVNEALEEARYAMEAYKSDGYDPSGMYSEYDRTDL
jgi:hypothetical protein